jgi:predicted nucleotide-binding protein (sugar kinase/HSP70/actin superfamily)
MMTKYFPKRKITFPHMGHYDPVFSRLAEVAGGEPVIADPINRETVENGVQVAPEFICFPCKINIGDELNAIAKGADTVVMFSSEGQCRFRYYAAVQCKILQDLGKKVEVFIFSPRNFLKKFKEISGRSSFFVIFRIIFIFRLAKFIEYIEQLGYYYRPRAVNKEAVTRLQKKYWQRAFGIKSYRDLRRSRRAAAREFAELEIDPRVRPIKIGIVGEIYSIIEPFVNQNIEEVLGNLGVEVHRGVNLSYFVTEFLHKKKEMKKVAPYLKHVVGGHGLNSVAHTLEYIEKGYDGVIHMAVFGCMPEVSIRPILSKISRTHNFPLISLSLDEHSGQAGIQTRVEAFVDLIRSKKKK